MYYWNQTNHKDLKEIAELLQQKCGYENYISYCLLREQGLKKQALVELRTFIDKARTLSIVIQRDIAIKLTELSFYNRNNHQLLPQPAVVYITQLLMQWCDENPNIAHAYRWCGVISEKTEFFERALSIDSEDVISLHCLTQYELNSLDFATHHLSDSVLLCTESDAQTSLSKAAEYANRLPLSELKNRHLESIAYYQTLLNVWGKYQEDNKQQTFLKWCDNQGYKFSLGSVYYYGNGDS